jgi:hypothetical protein
MPPLVGGAPILGSDDKLEDVDGRNQARAGHVTAAPLCPTAVVPVEGDTSIAANGYDRTTVSLLLRWQVRCLLLRQVR